VFLSPVLQRTNFKIYFPSQVNVFKERVLKAKMFYSTNFKLVREYSLLSFRAFVFMSERDAVGRRPKDKLDGGIE
jgi:hypothetical protein